MSMPLRIEVKSGAAPWLLASRRLAFLLAGLGLVFSPIAWPWTLGTLLVLLVSWAWAERPGAECRHGPVPLVIHLDGRLLFRDNGRETHGVARPEAWISRWFCVLRWRQDVGGHKCNSLVCASENDPEDYRRLLTWLRLGAFRGGKSAG